MLKTIRLSKNIFSLTERLPKAKYRSPKVLSIPSGDQAAPLLPSLSNQNQASRNNHANTIQPPNQDETKPIIKSVKQKGPTKSKSRLHDYADQHGHENGAGSGGYEEEEFDSDAANPNTQRVRAQKG